MCDKLGYAGYPAIFYYPVLVPDLAKMYDGTGYHHQIFYFHT